MSNLMIFCSHSLWSEASILPMYSILYALKHYVPEWQVPSSATNILCIHLGSLDTNILYLKLFQNFFFHPFVSLLSFINLVAKLNIFIKLLMYDLSHGWLLSSYKAFFHLHTWFFLSCVFLLAANVSSYFMPRATNLALYPMMFPSTALWNYEIPFMSRY